MTSVSIVMPQMGQSVAEGTIVKWHKKTGDAIRVDEPLIEVESDKISFSVESPCTGTLARCLKGEGEAAAVGEIIGVIETEAPKEGSAPPVAAPPAAAGAKPHAGSDKDQILVSAENHAPRLEFGALPEITRDWLSPYVLRLALMNNVSMDELRNIRGAGRQGRITKDDLLRYLARRAHMPAPPAPTAQEGGATLPEDEVLPMTSIRRTIADHMVQSIRTSAHVTMVHEVDMTHAVEMRARFKDLMQKKHRCRFSYSALLMMAAARVIREFPVVNSSVIGTNIVRHRVINIGCAVALPDESLVVPVIRNVDEKTFLEVSVELDRLIERARQRSLTRADISDGTFSISNFGAFGSIIGTPIIYQPQVAILGMGAVFKAAVVVNNEVCVRDRMYLSFSFDHRVIDGAMGGRFLNALQKAIESVDAKALGLDA
jgi:2-oxoglutarate dehydrogenase E2 component (dihydrolipoamide succinyltransferase)